MLRRLFLLSALPALLLPAPAEARCRRPVAAEAGLEAVPSAPAAGTPDAAAATGGAGSADAAASEAAIPPSVSGTVRNKRPSPDADPAPSEVAAAPAPSTPPVPAAPAPAPAPAAPAETYAVFPGETLRTALTRWAATGGWELVWEAPNDYTLGAGAGFGGGLVPAVTQLMESLRANGAPFGAELFEGNRVVRVTRNR